MPIPEETIARQAESAGAGGRAGGGLMEMSDEDLTRALGRALWSVIFGALVGVPIFWIAWGWRSMVLFVVGAAIAATGILEWKQIVSAVLTRLAAGAPTRPAGRVFFWFFFRFAAAAAVLYVSLETLDGRVAALIAGLALALLAIMIEVVRLFRAWTL